MSAAGTTPLVRVPAEALDETWVGEQLLVTTRHRGVPDTVFGGLSDFAPGPPVLDPASGTLTGSLFLFLGGELVLVTAYDVVVAAPTPTALDVEPDIASSPYDS